jgi:hypothetical protein
MDTNVLPQMTQINTDNGLCATSHGGEHLLAVIFFLIENPELGNLG